MGRPFEGASMVADGLCDLARLSLDEECFSDALEYARKARKAAIACNDALLVPRADLVLGRALRASGRADDAIRPFRSAFYLSEKAGALYLLNAATRELEMMSREPEP